MAEQPQRKCGKPFWYELRARRILIVRLHQTEAWAKTLQTLYENLGDLNNLGSLIPFVFSVHYGSLLGVGWLLAVGVDCGVSICGGMPPTLPMFSARA
jgi:hypothetical protein